MSDFAGKVVLVTGGTRGIGRAIAKAFAAKGAKVAICGRDEAKTQAAAAEIASEASGDVAGFKADIASAADVDALMKAVNAKFGPIQVLVNNAGITRDGLLMRMKDEAWDEVLQTNLSASFYTCRAVCRDMIKARSGRIINLSSIVGLRGQGGQTNYAAAKAGIIGFTKALAQEVASRGITANVVAPGYIDTDMTSGFNEEARKKLMETIPAGRVGTPDDIAAAVVFLASDAAAYVTGHVLCVDGGLGM
jgi:3-oxoacyl-[acyl-carrier protein] reductase